jgi:murein L,D-transpeptidase YcbB/YkuD
MNKVGVLLAIIFMIGCGQKINDSAANKADSGSEDAAMFDESVSSDLPTAPAGESSSAISEVPPAEKTVDLTMASSSSLDQPIMANTSRELTAENIQKALQAAGLYQGKIDGKIGPRTKKAIEKFQEQNGLTADGKVGAKTWAKLSIFLDKGESLKTPSAN